MNEEVYAEMLQESAKRTSFALKEQRCTEKNLTLFERSVHVFHEVRESNNHDINILIEEFAKLAATTVDTLLGRDRTLVIANTRNVMFYVLHKHIGLSNPQIARIFNRDPSTVQTGRVRGKSIVNNNQFLVHVIKEVVNKSKTNGGYYDH